MIDTTLTENECLCSIALTQIPGIGLILAKRLIECVGNASDVFRLRKELRGLHPEITPTLIKILDCPEAFARAEREMTFIQKNRITCLTLSDANYPFRLKECEDAPAVLFFRGNTDLNAPHIICMVGTRQATDYGKQFCSDFIHGLHELCPDTLVVSGLAYGIDISSHRAALANDISTIGVLAHGLDRIYPQVHRKTAIEMLESGGLLTEYISGIGPERYNFVARNRIVAGMSDATIVVESAEKGGSLITAKLATGYGRECFAVPGRITDPISQGCNRLIREQEASLITSAEDFVNAIGWNTTGKVQPAVQRELFPELTADEEQVVNLLRTSGETHINTLAAETNIPVYKLSALLFELEMKGVVRALVGGMYAL
jgi:DNA processing protein